MPVKMHDGCWKQDAAENNRIAKKKVCGAHKSGHLLGCSRALCARKIIRNLSSYVFASFIVSRRSLACVLEHVDWVRCFSHVRSQFTISWFSPYSPENFHNGAARYEFVWCSYNVEEVCPLLRIARVFQMPFSSINLCILGRDCLLSYRIATSIHNWTRRSTSCPNVLTLTWRSAEVSA